MAPNDKQLEKIQKIRDLCIADIKKFAQLFQIHDSTISEEYPKNSAKFNEYTTPKTIAYKFKHHILNNVGINRWFDLYLRTFVFGEFEYSAFISRAITGTPPSQRKVMDIIDDIDHALFQALFYDCDFKNLIQSADIASRKPADLLTMLSQINKKSTYKNEIKQYTELFDIYLGRQKDQTLYDFIRVIERQIEELVGIFKDNTHDIELNNKIKTSLMMLQQVLDTGEFTIPVRRNIIKAMFRQAESSDRIFDVDNIDHAISQYVNSEFPIGRIVYAKERTNPFEFVYYNENGTSSESDFNEECNDNSDSENIINSDNESDISIQDDSYL